MRRAELAGAANLELVQGVAHLRPEDAMLEGMLRGWRNQQTARGLRAGVIKSRDGVVRSFVAFTNEYPWAWTPAHVEEWTVSLLGERKLARSTVRNYQLSLRIFSEFVLDSRYGWAAACEQAFGLGQHPVPICHEWNTIAHLSEYEGAPESRAFTRNELQAFFDYADEQVEQARRARRKGALVAYRDATMFKVIYGWGLRRTEAARLDVADWGRNASVPEFGDYGSLHVRHGKAKRGQPARRRSVLSVMDWAVEAVSDYVENVRPLFRSERHQALWPTERGGHIRPGEVSERFTEYRRAVGLPEQLTAHSLRHSYVTHLMEDGADRRFVQMQVGHEHDSSLSIYAHVSDDFLNTALRRAVAAAWPQETRPHREACRRADVSSDDRGETP